MTVLIKVDAAKAHRPKLSLEIVADAAEDVGIFNLHHPFYHDDALGPTAWRRGGAASLEPLEHEVAGAVEHFELGEVDVLGAVRPRVAFVITSCTPSPAIRWHSRSLLPLGACSACAGHAVRPSTSSFWWTKPPWRDAPIPSPSATRAAAAAAAAPAPSSPPRA